MTGPQDREAVREIRPAHGSAPEPTPDGFLVPPGMAEDLMQALRDNFAAADAWYESQVTAAGPIPWYRRARWALSRKLQAWRDRTARHAYKLIAGYDVPDGDDW